ncbi:TetR/AcrR family transcriptional regulator [Aquabacterium sp.]|uniref:TetR/AcrR family transcriptional regulator n=1 Tax=Aquabacterium sp. TaxID=1872578 RepID=UPI0037849A64
MRYARTHKDDTRRKLLGASRAIAKRGGFGSTGVDALMGAIGLTGGAFYSHFPSKQALFEALIAEEMDHSREMLAGDDDADAAPDAATLARRLRGYLSSFHALNPEAGCVLPTLGPEIARSTPAVRRTVERALKQTHQRWAARLGDGDQDDADGAWALLAQCVGALVLARAVESERARKDILAANRRDIERTRPALRKA